MNAPASSTQGAAATRGRIVSLNLARAQPLRAGSRTVLSGIAKRPAAGRVPVHALGLDGDEQADPTVHGGLAKAVYAYPHEHYPLWRTMRAQARVSLWDEEAVPGLMGENLTLTGLLEADAWIGDVLRFADCALAISEPRYPCFKFEAVMGFKQAAKMMVASGTCGFYLAVREPGSLAVGDEYRLEPGSREVSIDQLFRARTTARR
ncbi:MOSC domain-containing protein [Rivibacter subsaxonicus]|uniref:MOSC domain-containing protein YiiM n=1 Tax=Rivibacter subsaxonicus TaxID=457575 RepID=A0A4Q7VVY7_9BURK|nr:MOSC domain-containing protein [Rivibacter subsaxonicus]RZU00763.1 MOSC domain-containing protein YiiM [Rivibacter subsaxonicus]